LVCHDILYNVISSNGILSNNSLSNNNFKTGLPIANVPFPSVVICSQGINIDGITAASIKLAFDYAKKTSGKSTKVLPLQLLNFLNKGVRDTVLCFEKIVLLYIFFTLV
jgi:hypothetical protein